MHCQFELSISRARAAEYFKVITTTTIYLDGEADERGSLLTAPLFSIGVALFSIEVRFKS